jgi:hypothetical protein
MIVFALLACTGAPSGDDTAPDTEETDVDTSPPEPEPVWAQWPVGSSSTLNGVYASGEGVYVAGTAAGAYNGGADQDWIPLETGVAEEENFGDLWGQGAGSALELALPATSGNMVRFTAGHWVYEDLGTANHEGVGGSGPNALFAVSWGGVYAYDGTAWTFESPPTNERLNDVWGSGGDAIAVGEGGAIIRRSGGVWTALESGVSTDLNGIAGTGATDLWAVGADGVALHYDGGGWTATTTGITQDLWAVFAPSASTVYAVGSNGAAIKWDGTEWTSLPTGIDNNLYAVHGATATNIWAVGNRGMAIQYKEAD